MTSSDYLILFGDLIGSTEVASEASPSTFSKLYIASFYLAMKCAKRYIEEPMFPAVPFTKIIEGINLSGDEVFSFTEITGIDDNLTTPVFTTVDPVPSFNLEVNNSSKQIALETIENHINGASNSDFINRLNTFKNYLDNLDVSSLMDKDSENNPIASSKNLFKLIDDNNQESIHYIQIG